MDGIPREDMERLIFFETAREKAAADYIRSPQDADNLTRWGGALLELAHFRQGNDAVRMIEDSESKLEEALGINPKKHETLWCLGNAHTAHGFLLPDDSGKANELFKKATGCFQKALDEAPNNETYMRSLAMCANAPGVYAELQKEVLSQQLGLGGGGGGRGGGMMSSPKSSRKRKKKSSDFKYDVMGWGILVLGIVVWAAFSKAATPRTP